VSHEEHLCWGPLAWTRQQLFRPGLVPRTFHLHKLFLRTSLPGGARARGAAVTQRAGGKCQPAPPTHYSLDSRGNILPTELPKPLTACVPPVSSPLIAALH
jgi:hypothetical protein